MLAVVRSQPLQERPYTGMVPISSGEVAEDLARYMVDSEQTNSALGLGVSVNKDTSIRAAGGFLLQVGNHLLQVGNHLLQVGNHLPFAIFTPGPVREQMSL